MNVRRLTPLLAVLALSVVMLPASAAAKGGSVLYAPPGHAGASEYSEDLPTSGGSTTQPTNLSAPSPVQLNKLGQGRQGARKLVHDGTQGKAALDWARATAPRQIGSSSSSSPTATTANLHSGSAVSGIADVLSGSDVGGLGAIVPLLLGLMLAAAIGFAAGRRFSSRRA